MEAKKKRFVIQSVCIFLAIGISLLILLVFLIVVVIAPGFHSLFLEAMVKVFTDCSERTISKFESLLDNDASKRKEIELDLEAEFSSLALDIIGLGVFNYDFGSVTKESPVIQVLTPNLFLLWPF